MFTLDTFALVKCTYFIVWISYWHRAYGLRLLSICFALICFSFLTQISQCWYLLNLGLYLLGDSQVSNPLNLHRIDDSAYKSQFCTLKNARHYADFHDHYSSIVSPVFQCQFQFQNVTRRILARRLATANRSCVSIRVNKNFGQGRGIIDPADIFPTSAASPYEIWLLFLVSCARIWSQKTVRRECLTP